MGIIDGLAAIAGELLGKITRDAPPAYNRTFSTGQFGIPAHPKAGEGQRVYQRNPWVYAMVNAIVNVMSTTEIFLRKRTVDSSGSVEFQRIAEHQALELLKNPLPKSLKGRSYITSGMLKQITGIHLFTAGEAFWALGGRVGSFGDFVGVPTEMHPLVPEAVEIKLDETNNIGKYIYTVGGKKFELEPENVVHFKLVDPRNPYRGQSALLAPGISIDTERESDEYLWHYFKNNAMPIGLVHSEKEPKVEEQHRFKEAWNTAFRGAQGHGKIGFLWGGRKFEKITSTQTEMQFKELKEYNRDTILASMRVGKGMLGMMEDQSRANAEAQDYVFGKRVVYPFMVQWVEQLTSDYLPMFGGTDNLEFWFDEDSVVPDNEEIKAIVAEKLWSMGSLSPNEARKKFNIDPRKEDGADSLWMPINRVPISNTPQE